MEDLKPDSIEKLILSEVSNIQSLVEKRKEADLETVLFICLDGGEGVGKGTQIKILIDALKDVLSVETIAMLDKQIEGADGIRDLFMSAEAGVFDPGQTAALINVAIQKSAEQMMEVIGESLATGSTIFLGDRSPFTAEIYQGIESGQGGKEYRQANLGVFSDIGLRPSFMTLLDADPRVCIERKMEQGGDEVTRFEEMDLKFHDGVRNGFLELSQSQPDDIPWAVIDVSQDIGNVSLDILSKIKRFLEIYQDQHIFGEPSSLNGAEFWQTSHPVRAIRMLETVRLHNIEDVLRFCEVSRHAFFSLRDKQYVEDLGSQEEIAMQMKASLEKNNNLKRITQKYNSNINAQNEVEEEFDLDDLINNGWRKLIKYSKYFKKFDLEQSFGRDLGLEKIKAKADFLWNQLSEEKRKIVFESLFLANRKNVGETKFIPLEMIDEYLRLSRDFDRDWELANAEQPFWEQSSVEVVT